MFGDIDMTACVQRVNKYKCDICVEGVSKVRSQVKYVHLPLSSDHSLSIGASEYTTCGPSHYPSSNTKPCDHPSCTRCVGKRQYFNENIKLCFVLFKIFHS